MNKFINVIQRSIRSKEARFDYLLALGFFNSLSDEEFLKKRFKVCFGYELNLENPITFNEKIQWLKLHNRKPEYTIMVDKYKVREYIARILGEEKLIPLLGVWDDPDEINFDILPEQFVLKCNHNSGKGMCICRDKSKLNINKTKNALKRGLHQNYYITGREWPYRDVPRKIVAEKYMVDENGLELKDYKIFNFNGRPKIIEVDFNRFTNHKRNFFTTSWEKIDLTLQYPSDEKIMIEKPRCLDKMLIMAEKLSESIPFVRTDFYCINEKIYFGEISFYPDCGFGKFNHEEWNKAFGEWIDLSGRLLKGDF